jgi:hypothetical protein
MNAIESALKNPGVRVALLYGGGAIIALYLLPKIIPPIVKAVTEALGATVKAAAGAAAEATGQALNAVSPTNQDNVFYDTIVGGIGRGASGDPNWTLGGWVYDVFHTEYDPNAGPTGANLIGFVAQAPLRVHDYPSVVR